MVVFETEAHSALHSCASFRPDMPGDPPVTSGDPPVSKQESATTNASLKLRRLRVGHKDI